VGDRWAGHGQGDRPGGGMGMTIDAADSDLTCDCEFKNRAKDSDRVTRPTAGKATTAKSLFGTLIF